MSHKVFDTISTQRYVPYSFDPHFLETLSQHEGKMITIHLKFNNGVVAEGVVLAKKNMVALLSTHDSLLSTAEMNTNWVLASLPDGTIVYYGADRTQDAAEKVATDNGWTTEEALVFLQLSSRRPSEDTYALVAENYWQDVNSTPISTVCRRGNLILAA